MKTTTSATLKHFAFFCALGALGAAAQEEKPQDAITGEDLEKIQQLLLEQPPRGALKFLREGAPGAELKEVELQLRNLEEARRALKEAHGERAAEDLEEWVSDFLLMRNPESWSTETPSWVIGVVLEEEDEEGKGLRVSSVMRGFPAARAGLKEGDLLRSLNGLKVKSVRQLRTLLQGSEGQEVTLLVIRGEEELQVALEARRRPLVPREEEEHAEEEEQEHHGDHGDHEHHGDREDGEEKYEEEILETLEGIHETMEELLDEMKKMRRRPPAALR